MFRLKLLEALMDMSRFLLALTKKNDPSSFICRTCVPRDCVDFVQPETQRVCVCVCACSWLPAHVCVHLGYLFRGSHEVNGGVVVVVVLKQAEGKLVVDQQVV